MTIVTMAAAKTHLSRLIAQAKAGGEVVIARGRTPAVRLVPVAERRTLRPGTLKRRIAFDERFWEPLPADELPVGRGGRVRLLLDTSTLIWWTLDADAITRRVHDLIVDPANDKLVSAVSAMAIATKVRLGRLPETGELATEFEAVLADQGLAGLPLQARHGRPAGLLPAAHKDPFDRMLAAQAILDGLTLVSSNGAFDQFGVQRLW